METDALAAALNKLANATEDNAKLLKQLVEGSGTTEKQSYEERKKQSSLEKIAYYTVQEKVLVYNRETFNDTKTFKSRVEADNYLAKELKGKGRIIVKVQYLSSKQENYEEQKRADNGESLDIQGTQKIPGSN